MKKIVVLGSFVTDLAGRAGALPLPGETIMGSSFKMGPGGKGSNQAVAAHRMGADITLITKVGNDVFGKAAISFYQSEGMDTEYVLVDKKYETGAALILVDDNTAQNAILVVSGACAKFTKEDLAHCAPLLKTAGVLLLQHEINFDIQYAAIDIARASGSLVVLNPAPAMDIPEEILKKIDVITPNETEAKGLTGVTIETCEDAARAARVLIERGIGKVVITMGALGAYATDGDREEHLPCLPVEAIDTTGAGDAFNGAFATALAEDKDVFTAQRYGNAAGALSVTKPGTAPAMPTRAEVEQLYKRHYS